MNIVEAMNIRKSFNKKIVLDNISFQLSSGKIYGLIGDNGSGKSVLLKCLCGILPCDSGKILISGKEIITGINEPPILGIVIEHPGFLGSLSGWSNLKYLAGIRGKISDDKIREALELVGLQNHSEKKVKKYSLGMRQKLAIAQAVMENPSVYFMDEPFNGLDSKSVIAIQTLFRSLRNEGKTFLLVSHHASDIDNLCDEIFEIRSGQLRQVTKEI